MKTPMKTRRQWLLAAACPLLAFCLAACSYQSVRHLNRQAWTVGEQRSLAMNYLDFEYVTALNSNGVRIQGRAYPKPSAIPEWAHWTQDIWLATYLCNSSGKVLAKKIVILPPQKLNLEKGFAFDFLLEPKVMAGASPIFVTFGYRIMLSEERCVRPKDFEQASGGAAKGVFFASESALTMF